MSIALQCDAAQHMLTVLMSSCRTMTGTLESTPLPGLYRLRGISPREVSRGTIARVERIKQLSDPRHPLHDHQEVPERLQSRRSFTTVWGKELTKVLSSAITQVVKR